jgi:hypothetical protein
MAAVPPAAIGPAMQEVFNALMVCELPPGAIFVLTQVDMFNTLSRIGRLATDKEVTKHLPEHYKMHSGHWRRAMYTDLHRQTSSAFYLMRSSAQTQK